MAVTTAPTRLHRRTPIWRKLWAIIASGTIGVVLGAVLATVVSAGLAWTVVTLTHMLRR